MTLPLNGASFRVTLAVQKHSHGIGASETCHQELILSRDHNDVRVWRPVSFLRGDLRDWKNLSHGGVGNVDQTVREPASF